jgi:hypothetical protein
MGGNIKITLQETGLAFNSLRIGTSGGLRAPLKAVNFVTCPTTSFPKTLLPKVIVLLFFNVVGWCETEFT